MFVEYDEMLESFSAYAEVDDKCYLCRNVDKCPLIDAAASEFVVLRYETVQITNCRMFTEL